MRQLPALLLAVLAACGSGRAPISACTTEFVYGLRITVLDATTGGPIVGATIDASDDGYTETLDEIETGLYVGAGERPGLYSLRVNADGFRSAKLDSVVVSADACHVTAVERTVTLTPIPGEPRIDVVVVVVTDDGNSDSTVTLMVGVRPPTLDTAQRRRDRAHRDSPARRPDARADRAEPRTARRPRSRDAGVGMVR